MQFENYAVNLNNKTGHPFVSLFMRIKEINDTKLGFIEYECLQNQMSLDNGNRLTLIIRQIKFIIFYIKLRRGRDRMVVGFTTTYAISLYTH